jgi:hypothetical protein
MKKLILAITILGLAVSQVQTASARVYFGAGVSICGIGVGASFGIGCAHPSCYNSPYYCGPRPYWGSGFYSSGYYYPNYYNYAPADYYSGYNYNYPPTSAPVATQAQPAPQNVTINNYYNTAPTTPMTSANTLFGR